MSSPLGLGCCYRAKGGRNECLWIDLLIAQALHSHLVDGIGQTLENPGDLFSPFEVPVLRLQITSFPVDLFNDQKLLHEVPDRERDSPI